MQEIVLSIHLSVDFSRSENLYYLSKTISRNCFIFTCGFLLLNSVIFKFVCGREQTIDFQLLKWITNGAFSIVQPLVNIR